ncbi:MAG TPA: translation initiation factor IF-2 [Ignavibacteriaceae bacterium]|nr:translation initiation factor IF-2 [Ignavibacteriaceae bacterium]
MTEPKSKKIRIYKLASEHNLSAEAITEFLQKKGYEVKNHMSLLTEEMITEVSNHFKKDIEKAEKHYQKLAEFNKKRKEKTEAEAGKEKTKTLKVSSEPVIEIVEIEKPSTITTPPSQIKTEGEIKIPVAEELLEEVVTDEIEIKQPEVESPVQPEVEETIPIPEEEVPKKKSFISPKDIEGSKRKGLKVVGKMDLNSGKLKKPGVEEVAPEPKIVKEEIKLDEQETLKKKKKPRTKKKADEVPTVEETPATKKKKRIKRFEIDQKDVTDAIRKTLISMDETGLSQRALSRKRKRKEREEQEDIKEEKRIHDKSILRVTEYIAVNELANLMEVNVSDVIAKCIELGLMVSINQRLDVDTITLVADEFGFQVEFQEEYTSEELEDEVDKPETLKFRSPVVTVMGHVDHGKTSLLDYIRRANVVAGESGGITQHIGAYRVDVGNGKFITFLDTPGHEAFTAMRARGAQLTDIVVLVIAADDAVMPQTIEAINHAQAASVPIVIAINKIDKPGANPDRIRQQLADRNILVEDWGGKYQCIELSAKSGLKVDVLLEKILLESELLDLKANPDRHARGVVVESELDKGRGITSTILIQKGTLRIGDPFVAGIHFGKVRAMFDERGNKVTEAPPSTPVQTLGFEGPPQAGDSFIVVDSERTARAISNRRQQLKREIDQKQVHHITLDEISNQISIGGVKELALIVKGDVDGSVEALSDSLMKLSTQEVIVRVIHKGVGGISENDVLLASASNAIIIGFHVRPNLNARRLAENQKVDIRLYSVIYNAINEVKSALEGLLSPILSEEVTSTVEVRETFKVPKVGTVAGCYVQEGKLQRSNKIRLLREGIVIFEGDIDNLKRFKDDVREVEAGYECGLNIRNYNDLKIGDIIESFKIIETKKKLS